MKLAFAVSRFCVVISLALPATLAFADQTTKYAYDALGRLRYSQVIGGTPTGQVEYRYDAAGNRTRYIVSGSTSSGGLAITPVKSNVLLTAVGVTLKVNVTGFPPASGKVKFTEGGADIGSTYVYDGQAVVELLGFAVGTHSITAQYDGDSFNAPHSYTFTITVRDLRWMPAVLDLILSD